MDKEEITAIGRRIGTYDISIQPHDDCCTYLMPRRPALSSSPKELEEVEKELDVDALVKDTLDRAELERIRPE